jgi:endonuclease/exonuclease/phosphatase family metal-dependent hydrolase
MTRFLFTLGTLSLLIIGLPAPVAAKEPSLTQTPKTLRVFQFNIWQEGTSVKGGFDLIINAIIASKADVIALSEVRNYHGKDLHQRMIQALHKKGHTFYGQYAGGDAGLLSRYPIKNARAIADFTKTDQGCIIAYTLQLPGNHEFIVCSAHLDYKNFAIYLPRGYHPNTFKIIDTDGNGQPNPVTDTEKLHDTDLASKRDEAIADFLAFSKKHPSADIILAGDFNECSHLDWTKATKNLYSHNGVVIEWKNSLALEDAGFCDSFREIYPNPLTHWGATWPSDASGKQSTSWAPKVDERDRIDFIYYNQTHLQATASYIVGSKNYYVYNRLTPTKDQTPFLLTDIPWPSDHKGLIVDFKINFE